MNEPLKAASNVIELKPGHKYLLVFKGDMTIRQIEPTLDYLGSLDAKSLGIALAEQNELQVIEVPDEQ